MILSEFDGLERDTGVFLSFGDEVASTFGLAGWDNCFLDDGNLPSNLIKISDGD